MYIWIVEIKFVQEHSSSFYTGYPLMY